VANVARQNRKKTEKNPSSQPKIPENGVQLELEFVNYVDGNYRRVCFFIFLERERGRWVLILHILWFWESPPDSHHHFSRNGSLTFVFALPPFNCLYL